MYQNIHDIHINTQLSLVIGILILFFGMSINRRIKALRDFAIPEAVTGGIIGSVIITILIYIFNIQVSFDAAQAVNLLMLYFFATVGFNASFSDIRKGGKKLTILVLLSFVYLICQNFISVMIAYYIGNSTPIASGVMMGSITLSGGFATLNGWADTLGKYGVQNIYEIGLAVATLGLIVASVAGGPVARYLIKKHNLKSSSDQILSIGIDDAHIDDPITYRLFLSAFLVINIAVIMGELVRNMISSYISADMIPSFLYVLISAILISNIGPKIFKPHDGKHKAFKWPHHTRALSLLAEISLGLFLVMTLLNMKIYQIFANATLIISVIVIQLIFAILYIIFIVFRFMGKDYDAAVTCSGFTGIAMGATPTAMMNMGAIAKKYGPSPISFVVLPLVCALFIDIINVSVVSIFLAFSH
ncbi:MAG: ESS family glutamate:Na+ symporter [Francisella sp.]|jgi:ESS family glutamate:Na+ symporter